MTELYSNAQKYNGQLQEYNGRMQAELQAANESVAKAQVGGRVQGPVAGRTCARGGGQ